MTLSRLDLLKQEQASVQEFSLTLQRFVEEKFKDQLLERQQPTDIFTLPRDLLTEFLSLPQRVYDWGLEKIQSGAVTRLVVTYRSQLLGLLFFLATLLYAMASLRRATRDLRQNLAAGAETFSLKLIMALANVLARNYYLLAVAIWVTSSLWVMGVLRNTAAQILLYRPVGLYYSPPLKMSVDRSISHPPSQSRGLLVSTKLRPITTAETASWLCYF